MTETKKLPKSLLILLTLLAAVCIGILVFMLQGFEMFETFQPNLAEEPTMPATPGYP